MLFATKSVIICGFWINPWWLLIPAALLLIAVGLIVNKLMSRRVDED